MSNRVEDNIKPNVVYVVRDSTDSPLDVGDRVILERDEGDSFPLYLIISGIFKDKKMYINSNRLKRYSTNNLVGGKIL